MNTLIIDIGGSKFTVAAFEQDRLALCESRSTDRAAGREWMLEQVLNLARQFQQQRRFSRCGIGFGGPVRFPDQRVALSTHVAGWQDFPLPAFLSEQLGLPAVMDNDANLGALGEAVFGAGAGLSPLLYVTISTGIGGGVVVDGHIYRGADSWAGEIGHLTVRPEGPLCLCGARGCLERMCSGLWLETDHGRPAHELLAEPDFVRRYVVDLALGLKAAVMLLNPARIVIGGGISKAGEALFAPLREELRRQITPWSGARIDVAPAALGDSSVLFGALVLARQVKRP